MTDAPTLRYGGGVGAFPLAPAARLQGMNREERRRILGDDVIACIHARVKEAPDPSDELVEELRRIMTRPAGEVPRRTEGSQSD